MYIKNTIGCAKTCLTAFTAAPIMQALAMAFPDEKGIAATDDTYIFCDEILVSPVLESGTEKNVAFPKGKWYSLYNGAAVSGGSTLSVSALLDTTPAYLKSGAILPVTLSASLKLCDPIDKETAVKALIVTPPDKERLKTFYSEDGSAVSYGICPKNYAYIVSAGEGNQATTVLAYCTDPLTVTVDGAALRQNAWMRRESDKETGRWGGSLPDSAAALTPQNVNSHNFEATVKFKLNNDNGKLGTVALEFRETSHGQRSSNLGNWDNFGRQIGGAVSFLACAADGNTAWLYSGGAKLCDTSVGGAAFGKDFYTLRVRAVEKECEMFIYDSAGELIFSKALNLPDSIAERGAVSYYATNECLISEITLTALDGGGNSVDMPYYADGDVNRDGRTAADDIALIK